MVGIPRSKGCRTCVTRRVRCDLGKPVCNNCKKGNRDCLYNDGLKFVNEATKLQRKYEHREKTQGGLETILSFDVTSASSSSNNTPNDSRIESPEEQSSQIGSELILSNEPVSFRGNAIFGFIEHPVDLDPELLDLYDPIFDAEGMHDVMSTQQHLDDLGTMIFSPNLIQDQLFQIMYQSMFPPGQTASIPTQMRTHGAWFTRLPPMTGRNKLLDSAMRAVSLAHLGRWKGSRVHLEEARPWYGSTLRQLNAAITDNEAGMAPETLAATILLSFYEMFSSSSNQSWVSHAGGAGALMRARGPEVHRFGFDREMFIAYRHTVIIEAAQRDEPCFLSEPAWRELSKNIFHDLRSQGEERFIETFDLAEMQYETMLEIPDLLHRCKHFHKFFKKERDQFPTLEAFVTDLVQRVQQVRGRFKQWFVRFKIAMNKTGFMWTTYLSHDPVIPLFYQFPNIFVGSSVTGYWTINILLNLVLIELLQKYDSQKCSLYKAENRDSALEICRSVHYMLSSSFLGPFFLIFGLRVSLGALLEKQEQEWVVARLFQIGETHMAMAAHIPGFEAGADMPRVRAALSTTESKLVEIDGD